MAIEPPAGTENGYSRFGVVTGLAITYTFVASVVVLPSLLVLRDRRRNEPGRTGDWNESGQAEE